MAAESLKEVESEEEWPPRWRDFMYCPQVMFGMIQPDIHDLNLEKLPDIGNLRKFYQQVRDSRGYDVDCHPPASMGAPYLRAFKPEHWLIHRSLLASVKFALKEINAQAQKHGESYELVDLVRFVKAAPNRMNLLTFNVRQVTPDAEAGALKTIQAMVFNPCHQFFELREWRFRPGPPETAPKDSLSFCEDAPPYIPPGFTDYTPAPLLPW